MCIFHVASAKTGENVDKILTDVVKHMHKRKAALAPDTLYDDRAVRCPSGAMYVSMYVCMYLCMYKWDNTYDAIVMRKVYVVL